ncbi:MAG TPA: putative lipid II flippase FtsW [Parachlamydiaceae bacterium]|nr:putative lipid II flippase FtsW [Parachlamydiaceae bacterium]
MSRLILLIAATFIFAIGLIMIFSTTSAEVLDHDLDKSMHGSLVKQMLFAIAGVVLGLLIWKIGYQRLIDLSPALLVFFTFLLLLTLLPGIGREVNGSKRWLSIFGLSFQPSEFVKYLVPAFLIHSFSVFEDRIMSCKEFFKILGLAAIPMFLILIEPNNGTFAVIAMSVLLLSFLARISFKYWALPLLCFLVVGGAFAYNLPYVAARLKVYLHPELDLRGKGHQPYQAKIAAGSGALFGKGPGNSLQKLSYLPEAQNDYIAAIFAEEFGFLGIIVLILLYMVFALCGFFIAFQQQEMQGFYMASTIVFLISFQAFLNLGVVSGTLPSTGLNLPLFSQGGTSLMANIAAIGLLLNISKQKDIIPIRQRAVKESLNDYI